MAILSTTSVLCDILTRTAYINSWARRLFEILGQDILVSVDCYTHRKCLTDTLLGSVGTDGDDDEEDV